MNKWQHGFYKLTAEERRQLLVQAGLLSPKEREQLADHSSSLGDQLVENYISDYSLPEGVALGLRVNDRDYVVPMVVEEPSVIAAASNGAQRVAKSGGFTAPKQRRELVGQVVIENSTNQDSVVDWLTAHRSQILAIANAAHPSMQKRGGGAEDFRVRKLPGFISLDLLINVCQAMGANTVNTMSEAVAHWLTNKGYHVLTAILSNLATDSLQTVECVVDPQYLASKQFTGEQVASRIAQLSQLAQVDPYRATTNNKGIMNGVDAALIASGNDWRAIESGAHAYACRSGQYRGLSRWHYDGHRLSGQLTLPMPVGVVGGSIGLNHLTKINYRLSRIQSAEELAAVITSLGLAQNLAALRALATSGIQAGHMKLQYRSLAISVGATPAEVEPLVARLTRLAHVDHQVAQLELEKLREDRDNG